MTWQVIQFQAPPGQWLASGKPDIFVFLRWFKLNVPAYEFATYACEEGKETLCPHPSISFESTTQFRQILENLTGTSFLKSFLKIPYKMREKNKLFL